MTYYFISDLHVDFYSPMARSSAPLLKAFEKFYEQNFLPADACCIAGDIANNYFTYVEFLKFIATKYAKVYLCLGNHDIITEKKSHYGKDRDFLTSEEKIEFFCNEAAKIQNVHLLENRVADGIAGCMGMCDFEYKHVPGATAAQNKTLWKFCWFDGRHWNYKGNDPDALWQHYDQAMQSLTQQQPSIMMTHFLPLEIAKAKSTCCSAIPSATRTKIPIRKMD
ncbi:MULTISPECIES: metallophosphoesterase [unclassified Fibrobacter]|uniref:metallophosphoesterase n=1 Tax=unclassified Fibrobacter TaxID=2634177 RepID=UPI000D6BDEE8|nr:MULTISPECIES: metallophosphoesterase [unclassified Fibrobacter]PWJ58131.1 calcineurin-like phosphoesterase family protein [Fibrobacter sp. UWR4]PZW62832.1 calcineurin-like phosphoesterase family protein [Fibrobacter sp. UWR1]